MREEYEAFLADVDEKWKDKTFWKETNHELEKLYCLVKGNLLLRKGQREDIDLLIQVCLGKYFRNLGHYKKRSHFHIAVYELQKVIQWLREEHHAFDRQKTQIWLDVMANIGRAYKNLYNLAEAKRYFGEIIYAVSSKIGDRAERVPILRS